MGLLRDLMGLGPQNGVLVGGSASDFITEVVAREVHNMGIAIEPTELLSVISANPPDDWAQILSRYTVRTSYLRTLFSRELEIEDRRQMIAC